MALRETIERLRKPPSDTSDPVAIVSAWRDEVSKLYDAIANWLQPYIADGGIVLRREAKTRYEESTGSYDIEQLDIDVGSETVRLDPKAAVVIGARGRIDMSRLGSGEPLLLILTEAGGQSRWRIVDRAARTRLTPLTQASFEAAMERLLEDDGTRLEFGM